MKEDVLKKRLFEFKLKMQRAAKEIGKPLKMSGTKVLQSDARYKVFGNRIASGRISGMRGPMTSKQKVALKKAQRASAIARRKK